MKRLIILQLIPFQLILGISVPLRGNGYETSTGHLYSLKTCQIRNKTTNIKTETLTDRATSIGQRNNAIFKVDATYGGD